jgi:hypothetical protein
MEKSWELLHEFVHPHTFIMYNKIYRFINEERKSVNYSDTDSVFVYLGEWIFKCIEYISNKKQDEIKVSDIESNSILLFKITNIITSHLSRGISEILAYMTNLANIPIDFRKYIQFKNEMLLGRYIALDMQKNYVYRVDMQEGHMISPPKFSVKGGNLNAKAKNRLVTKRIQDIVKEVTMEHDTIQPDLLLYRMLSFKEEIIESLKNGDTTYLAPKKVKSADSYANPYSMYNFKAVEIYRIAENDESITLPGAFLIIDVSIPTKESLDLIKDSYPIQYERLFTDVFGNEKLTKGGIEYIAIPQRKERIPEWIRPYIHIENIWRKHISPLIALSPSLGIRIDTIRQNAYYSTILSF